MSSKIDKEVAAAFSLLVKCCLNDVELVGCDGASGVSQPTPDDLHRQLNSQLQTYNSAHSLTHTLTHSFIHSFICSFVHSYNSFTRLLTHSLTHWLNSQLADMHEVARQRTQSTGDDVMRRYDRRDELTVHWQTGREPGWQQNRDLSLSQRTRFEKSREPG